MFNHYLSCSIIIHHVQSLSIMFNHYLSCSIIIYHVQSLSIMFNHYPSCSIIIYHVQSLSIIFNHYLSCSIIIHHVQSLSIMFNHYLSFSIIIHHVQSLSIMFNHYLSLSMIIYIPASMIIYDYLSSIIIYNSLFIYPTWLVADLPLWKNTVYESQIGSSSQLLGKITKHVPNHQPVMQCSTRHWTTPCSRLDPIPGLKYWPKSPVEPQLDILDILCSKSNHWKLAVSGMFSLWVQTHPSITR